MTDMGMETCTKAILIIPDTVITRHTILIRPIPIIQTIIQLPITTTTIHTGVMDTDLVITDVAIGRSLSTQTARSLSRKTGRSTSLVEEHSASNIGIGEHDYLQRRKASLQDFNLFKKSRGLLLYRLLDTPLKHTQH
jgi:hypothetical protein